MSYILDALRKADAQRERDPARGIHAQPTPLASESAMRGASSTRWLWVSGIAGIAVIAGAVWYLGKEKAAVPAAGPTTATAPASIASPAPAPAPLPAPARTLATLPPPAAPVVQPPPQPARTPPRDPTNASVPPMRGVPQANLVPPNAPGPLTHGGPAAAREAAFAASAGVPARPAISAPAPLPAGPVPAPAAATAQAVTGLPPDAPRLVISGGVYSPSAVQRMLIVNGQVFNEGSEVAAGVTVEEIKPRTVVLKFRGARYTVAY